MINVLQVNLTLRQHFGRDHSTVIHASKTIEKKIKEDPYMQTTIEKLERNLNVKK